MSGAIKQAQDMSEWTMRDQFACAALAGQCVDTVDTISIDIPIMAIWCYQMADAMMKARGDTARPDVQIAITAPATEEVVVANGGGEK